jgi:predicted nucleic acid-binding protein
LLLVDSTIYIDLLRSRQDPAQALKPWLQRDEILCCGVIRCEVLRGIRSEPVRARLRELFEIMLNIPTDESIWDDTTRLAWALDRRGTILPLTDLLIASCALRVEAAVISTDTHFRSIPGLKVTPALPASG